MNKKNVLSRGFIAFVWSIYTAFIIFKGDSILADLFVKVSTFIFGGH